MSVLDFLFSNFRWYRRLSGGVWYNVVPDFCGYASAWVRKPFGNEQINEIEDYPA